ncbi:hypothetical protein Pelo_423 [Pelomyxa schiedti]|nr:hypothetical protein Pelo_423 [Pelomyxa schiedti]
MVYLRDHVNMIHCDIKADNFLIDGAWTVKMGNFGFSAFLKPGQHKTNHSGFLMGTLRYMSPEVFTSLAYTKASDVYALAFVLFELFTEQEFFKKHTATKKFIKYVAIEKGKSLFVRKPSFAIVI